MNKTMISFRIDNKTRDLLLELQRSGSYRTQADVISAALDALAKQSNNTPIADSQIVQLRAELNEIVAVATEHLNCRIDNLRGELVKIVAVANEHLDCRIDNLRSELVSVNYRLMAFEHNDDDDAPPTTELAGDDSVVVEKKILPQLAAVN